MLKFSAFKIINIILSLLIIGLLGFFIYNFFTDGFGKAAIQVISYNGKATVYINNKFVGETPVYQENIFNNNIAIKVNGEYSSYSSELNPASGTLGVVTRDIGVSETFSSGLNIWLQKIFNSDQSYIYVTVPKLQDVSILVDDVEIGKAPVKVSTKELLKENKDGKYRIKLKKDGYDEQEVLVTPVKGYQLNIKADMFLIPIPKEKGTLDLKDGLPSGVNFLNFSKVSNSAFYDKKNWAKAINYWLKTRKNDNLFGNYKIEKFSFFVADNGEIYNDSGNTIGPNEMKLQSGESIVYLGFEDKQDLTTEAKNSLSAALNGKPIVDATTDVDVKKTDSSNQTSPKIKILPTGLGYLRIREQPTASSKEIGRAKEGQEYDVIEEKSSWYKIKFENDSVGWVSGSYAKKVQ